MSPEIVDWPLARRIGRAVAGAGLPVAKAEANRVAQDFQKHVGRADTLVRAFTHLEPSRQPGETSVLSRGAWVEANLDAIRLLTAPLSQRMTQSFPRKGARRLSGAAIAAQIGFLLGYISKKVLGQYDLLLSSGEPGRIYFVGPNILATETRHNLNPDDFRLWIALHEVTHRTQFLAVDWLREHVASLIERYLAGVTVDAGRIKELIARIKDVATGGQKGLRNASIVSIFLTEEQRDVVEEMQSLMSIVEGHGNFVMDGIAETEIPTYRELKQALQARRAGGGAAEKAFQRLIALDMKYEQYSTGQSFFDGVHALGGMSAVNAVWDSRDNVPSTEELKDPKAWLARVRPQPTLFEQTR